MPYKKKKVGTKQVQKWRTDFNTGEVTSYYVEVDDFREVWEDTPSADTSGYYSGGSDSVSYDSSGSTWDE